MPPSKFTFKSVTRELPKAFEVLSKNFQIIGPNKESLQTFEEARHQIENNFQNGFVHLPKARPKDF
ncbi:MAG: hypothetical protein LBV23_00145 [Deltaproteobacteria bacterium]|jgi:hypothetical protein|nr:hypothetical protein [Deltaproteobacteria bacterium]